MHILHFYFVWQSTPNHSTIGVILDSPHKKQTCPWGLLLPHAKWFIMNLLFHDEIEVLRLTYKPKTYKSSRCSQTYSWTIFIPLPRIQAIMFTTITTFSISFANLQTTTHASATHVWMVPSVHLSVHTILVNVPMDLWEPTVRLTQVGQRSQGRVIIGLYFSSGSGLCRSWASKGMPWSHIFFKKS